MQLYTLFFLVFKFQSSNSYCVPIACLNSYDAECDCESSIHRCLEEFSTHVSFYWDYYNASDCVDGGQQSGYDYRCHDVNQYQCESTSYIKFRSYDSCSINSASVSWLEEVESLGCAPYLGSYTDGTRSTYITCSSASMHVIGFGSSNCEGTVMFDYKSYAGCNKNINEVYLDILHCDNNNNYPEITTTKIETTLVKIETTLVAKANYLNLRIVLFVIIVTLHFY